MNGDRRGFALLVALWFIVVLGATVAVTLASERIEARAAANRILLTRAGWARDGCAALVVARYNAAMPLQDIDSIDLGHGTWCSAHIVDLASRININTASLQQLRALLDNDSLVDAIIDWRDADTLRRPRGAEASDYLVRGRPVPSNGDFHSVAELRLVRGFEAMPVDSLAALVTVFGDGKLNIASAVPALIATLPGLHREDAAVLSEAHAGGWRAQSLDDLLSRLGDRRREEVAAWLPALQDAVTLAPTELEVDLTGGVRNSPLLARATILAVPLPERLAVIRRILW